MRRMDLSTYVEQRGRQTELAEAIGCPPQVIWGWAKGGRPIPDGRCPSIEQATSGEVTCEELRPDVVWGRIADKSWRWHPKGRPVVEVSRNA